MTDFLSGIFDAIVLKLMAAGAVIGLAVGFISGLITQRHGSIKAWAIGMAASVVVGMGAYLGMGAVEYHPAVETLIVCVAAYCAEDILAGVRALAKMIGSDPLGTWGRILVAVRGGVPPPADPPDGGKQ